MTTSQKLPISLDELLTLKLTPPPFFFFWGHTGSPIEVDKACLSQWAKWSFVIDGVLYQTAEHYMMAEKARLFGDEEMLGKIMKSKTPQMAKRHGRNVAGFDKDVWEEHCHSIVRRGNIAKFTQNELAWNFLKSTAGKVLVEASPYDDIWGIGMREDTRGVSDPSKWNGTNWLGFILTEVREELLRT